MRGLKFFKFYILPKILGVIGLGAVGGTEEYLKNELLVEAMRPDSSAFSLALRRVSFLDEVMKLIKVLGGGGYSGTGFAMKCDLSSLSLVSLSLSASIQREWASFGLKRSFNFSSFSTLLSCISCLRQSLRE